MKAVVLEKARKITIDERPDPGRPGPFEVRVKIGSVGVCGSDVHYYAHGRIGDFIVEAPMILGHEAAGVIEEIGDGVTGLSIGDVVALEPGIPCGTCHYCKIGRYNLCEDVQFFATPPVDGALIESVVHPASFTYKAPKGMTEDLACLAEPMSVAVSAIRRAKLTMGEEVLVVGAGPIGVFTALVAEMSGANPTVVDVSRERLDIARQMGILSVHHSEIDRQFDVVIECSGADNMVLRACELVRAGGTVVLVGLHRTDRVEIPVFKTITRELNIVGVHRYANTYPAALSLLKRAEDRLQPMMSSFVTIDQVADHFENVVEGHVSSLKTIVRMR